MPGHRLSDYHRGRIVGLYQGGQSIGDIAKRESRSHQTISSIIHRDIAPDGSVNPPIHAKGRPDRQIPSPSKRAVLADIDQNRHTPTKTLANDHHISRQSIYKIASSAGLRSDKEELVPEIKSADENARLRWTELREQYAINDYIYTDEVGFTIGDNSQDTYVFRTPQERLDRDKTRSRVPTFRQLMVWGAIAHDFKPPLFIIPQKAPTPPVYPPPMNPPKNPNGSTLNQVKYAVWILQGRVWPMIQELRSQGRNPVLVEDGARPHNAEIPERIRQQYGILRFPHPAHSPDLNAIENVWSVLKRQVEARRPVAKDRNELIVHVCEEWAVIPMEVVNEAVESIARRVQQVRDAGGYATGH